MPSTTALFTGLSGLATNSRRLDVIGNNIANINTTAFKSSRMIFSPIFARNLSLGTAPSSGTGGTNPNQVGLGVQIASIQRDFNNGSITATGVGTDVAIEGDGFFAVEFGNERLYTRAGSFQQNSENDLITITGGRVMGYAVDDQFNVIQGNLVPINIPVGSLTLAEATRNVVFNGNLNASGVSATTGSVHSSRAFFTDTLLTPGNEMVGTEDLTMAANDLYIDDGAGGSFMGIDGGELAVVTMTGIEKGGKDLGTLEFGFMDATTAAANGIDNFGSTMNDFITFMEEVLGLNNTTINGQSLGGNITINAGGQLVITGNEGTAQDLDIETADLIVTYPPAYAGPAVNQPFVLAKGTEADGESVRTSFVVFDSLGTPVTVDLTLVLQETIDGQGTVWEFLAESSDTDDTDRVVGLGVVTFDENGEFVAASNEAFSVDRGNGAVSPLTISMDFDQGSNQLSALTDTSSNLAAVFQDGSAIGTLSSFSISEDGTIEGSFTNGLSRTLGQLALAKFANPVGMVDVGNNHFSAGPNAGAPIITAPLEFGTGRLIGGALELSNVDLSQEFINMILASTGYSASARVISTTDELIDQLLILGR